jgi:hypothetical protein
LRPFQIAQLPVADWLSLTRLTLCLPGDGDDAGQHVVHLVVGALDLDDQQRLDIHRISGMGERLADVDRLLVHELDGDRDDALADDVGDAGAGNLGGIEAEQNRPRAFRLGEQAHCRLRDDAELAFRPANQSEQVIAPRRDALPPRSMTVPSMQHHCHAEQVVGGHAVFQAVRAAGIHADIAADRAGELRRRVGRVEEAVGGNLVGNAQIGDARLHARRAVLVIDLENARHLRDADDNRVFLGDRAAGKRCARPARHHRDAVFRAVSS